MDLFGKKREKENQAVVNLLLQFFDSTNFWIRDVITVQSVRVIVQIDARSESLLDRMRVNTDSNKGFYTAFPAMPSRCGLYYLEITIQRAKAAAKGKVVLRRRHFLTCVVWHMGLWSNECVKLYVKLN